MRNKQREMYGVAAAFCVALVFLAAGTANAAPMDPELPSVGVIEVKQAPKIDGKLDDPCWKTAKETERFKDEYSFPVKLKTTFQVCQKDGVLYVGIHAYYDEKKPPKEMPKHPNIVHDGTFWQSEEIELFIDPDNMDSLGYYQFMISPEGATADFFCREQRDVEGQWEPDYEVKSHWTPTEWTVEYALPLRIFGRTEKVYEHIGFNVFRMDTVYWQVGTWSPMREEGFHAPHRFGELRGLKWPKVTKNEPGLFKAPLVKANDRVIRGRSVQTLIPEKKPAFVKGPRVKQTRKGTQISFEINTFTDVAVWVEDEKGERVRHIAAGMLGNNPPAPFKPGKLAQALLWDGADDYGKKVPAGKYTVRVGLRSKAELDRVIGQGQVPKEIRGVSVDADGKLTVIGGQRDQWLEILRYSRDGAYEKTLYPPSGALPPEKLKAMNIIDLGADGQIRWGSTRMGSYLPHLDQPMCQNMPINSKGQLIIFGSEYPAGRGRLYKINGDGSLPDDWLGPYVKDVIWTTFYAQWAKRFHIALDPEDEDIVYMSGIKETHRHEGNSDDTKNPRARFFNCVLKFQWGQEGPHEAFVGTLSYGGKDKSDKPGELFDPQGIAFDPDKNLWVCDRGNNRVQIFDRKGKFIRQFDVPGAYEVRFAAKKRIAYIIATEGEGKNRKHVLMKYSLGKNPKLLARSEPLGVESYWRTMAVDDTRKDVRIWVVAGKSKAHTILQVLDEGDAFSKPEPLIGKDAPHNYSRIGVGWDSDVVWAGGHWFDGKTGERIRSTKKGGRGGGAYGYEVLGVRDGTWVGRTGFFHHTISFYPEDLPFNRDATPIRSWEILPPALARNGKRGFNVAPNGDIYVARYYQFQQGGPARVVEEGPWLHVAVDHYGPDGTMKGRRVIEELSQAGCAPAVDIKGNIYVVDNNGRKIGELYEPDVAANLPSWMPKEYKIDWDKIRSGESVAAGSEKFVKNALIHTVGTVYKFGPEGGGLIWRKAQKGWLKHEASEESGKKMFVDWGFFPPMEPPNTPATHWSAKWVGGNKVDGVYPQWQKGVQYEFLGVGHASGRYNLWHSGCTCTNPRMCVDDFGRVYAPAHHRSCVRVIDTAGNEVLRIGRYNNPDPVSGIEIGMIYPHATALSKRFLYVSELRTARILKIKLGYEKQKDLPVKID
ncbi:MAG: esterase-like activity of phytase family protein [Lentisphaerae bacterium]|nr:esterase-like activity of phytase family protein [Lentisphaerota bacterium]